MYIRIAFFIELRLRVPRSLRSLANYLFLKLICGANTLENTLIHYTSVSSRHLLQHLLEIMATDKLTWKSDHDTLANLFPAHTHAVAKIKLS